MVNLIAFIVVIIVILIAIAILKAMRASDNVIISFLGLIGSIAAILLVGFSSGVFASSFATPIVGIPVGIIAAVILASVLFS